MMNAKSKNGFWDGAKFPIAIAHRGGGAAFGNDKFRKENTIEAFHASVELGYKYLEMDVISTADNQVIVIHVAKNRAEAGQGKKEAPNYQQLQQMTYEQISQKLNRHIPAVDEVLESFPDQKLFIDAKTDRVGPLLAKAVKNHRAQTRVVLGSFYPHRLIALRALLGDKVGYNLNISRSPVHLASQVRNLPKLSFISSVHLPLMFLSKKAVKRFHKKGIKVLVWTPNTHRQIEKCLRAGADGIISDNISLLKTIIRP